MYSYRHAFHAGNHADVLKHLTLVATLRHLMRKETPLLLVDTHAGAGIYRLDGDAAARSGEAQAGIARLCVCRNDDASNAPLSEHQRAQNAINSEANALQDYLSVLNGFNPSSQAPADWRVYPGSPLLMHALMTEPARAPVHDRLKLFEMHPSDALALQAHVDQLQAGRQVSVARQDGFAALKALLPPPASGSGSRRALVLIDPSYEIKSDYGKVAAAMQDALRRFAIGTYLIWYPIIPRPEAHDLPRRLKTLAQQAGRPWLHASLHVGQASAPATAMRASDRAAARPGLSASGMIVINPPHTLADTLRESLPQVLGALGQGAGQGWNVSASAA